LLLIIAGYFAREAAISVPGPRNVRLGNRGFSSIFVSLWHLSDLAGRADDVCCWGAGSTDRRNTFGELLSWGLIEQGFSRPFIELPCDRVELGLAVQGQIGAPRKILAQQSVGVFA
jgi:hypothetical protein